MSSTTQALVTKDGLVARSSVALRRAIRHYLDKEFDQFFIQAAVSFELLGKARLADVHPCLIVDRDFDSLLNVCGAGSHSKRPPWNIRTIGAVEVLKRCIQMDARLQSFEKQLNLLAELRNGMVHLGQVSPADIDDLLYNFLAASHLLAGSLQAKAEEYFGDFHDFVETYLDKSAKKKQKLVAEKIAKAKIVFAERFAGLDQKLKEGLMETITRGYLLTQYEEELARCPACERYGVASGNHEVEWEAEYDDDGTVSGGYPVVTLFPETFECKFCGLELSGSTELEAAGADEPIEIEDVDPADFYDPDDPSE